MTITRKLLILLSVLVFAVAACTSSDDTSDTSATETTATSDASGSSGSETTEPPPESEEPTTIRYFEFSSSPDHLDELDAMIAAFEAENPDVRVDVEHGTFDDYHTVLQTQIAANDAPDAFELNFENFVSFATKGTLADLGPLSNADPDFDAGVYYQPAYEAFALAGVQYGLPESYSTVLLFYNKDLFDQAGIDYPTDDWKWVDERAAAEAIAATGDSVWGFFAGVHYWEFYKTAAQNGCPIFGDDGSVRINEPGCVEALQYMLDYVNDGVQPTAAEMGGLSDGDMFSRSELGMITSGIWMFSTFESDADFDWDVVVEPGNTQGASHFFANGVAVSADSDKKEAAYRWLKFYTSSRESAEIRVGASWELPTLTDASVYEAYLAVEPPANREAVIASLENVIPPPVIVRQTEMQDLINGLLESALAGEITAQEALDQAKVGIEDLLD